MYTYKIYSSTQVGKRFLACDKVEFVENDLGQMVMHTNGPSKVLQALPELVSGYKNVARDAKVSATNKDGSDAKLLNDGLVALGKGIVEDEEDAAKWLPKEFTTSKSSTTITLTFDESNDGTYAQAAPIFKVGGVDVSTSWGEAIADGKWHHIAIVIVQTEGTAKDKALLYVDGAFISEAETTKVDKFDIEAISGGKANNLVVGSCVGRTNASSSSAMNIFSGNMRSLALFSDSRTAEEVANDYAYGISAKTEGLFALYNMNGQEDGIVEDLTNNGYDIYKTCYNAENADCTIEDMADNHIFTTYVSNNDATCGEDGTETAKCDNCARTHTKVAEGTATGNHTWVENIEAEGAFVSEANCEDGAFYKKSCSVCGALHETETFEYGTAQGHSFTTEDKNAEGAVVTKENCCEDGVYVKSCAGCGKVDPEGKATFTVPATGEHTFEGEVIVDGTITKKYCSVGKKEIYTGAITGDGMTFDTEAKSVYVINKKLEYAPITFETVVKFDAGTASAVSLATGYHGKGDLKTYYDLTLTGKSLRLRVSNNGTYAQAALTFKVDGAAATTWGDVLSDGEWHQLVVVIVQTESTAKDKAQLYVDGVLMDEIETTKVDKFDIEAISGGKANNLVIGSCVGRNNTSSSMNIFPGNMRSLALFSDSRTAEEIAYDYAYGISANTQGLFALYNMNGQEDGLVEDLTNNGYDIYKTCYNTEKADCTLADMAKNHVASATATYTYNNDATCGEDGTESTKCDYCAQMVTRKKAGTATGQHVYTNYVHDEGSETCNSYGTETAECDNCDTDATDTRNATSGTYAGHDYSAWETNGDQHWKECSACGTDDTTYVKENHTFDNACDTECNGGCGYTRTINHDYSVWENSETEHWKKCSICSTIDEESRDFHDFDNACDVECNDGCGYTRTTQHIYKNVVNADYLVSGANCEDDAVYKKSCMYCGEAHATETFEDEGSALGHKFENYVYDNDATCTDNGHETATCSRENCDKTDTRIKPNSATDHAYADTNTCHDRTCTNGCGHVSTATSAHSWNEGVETVKPTTKEEGEMTYTCINCGETKTEVIEKLPAKKDDGGCGSEEIGLALMAIATLFGAAFVMKK